MTSSRATSHSDDWGRMLFDSLSFPTIILDSNYVILAANSVFFKQFKFDKKIVGGTCFEAFADYCPLSIGKDCPVPDVFTSKKEASILARVAKDGKEMWEKRVFSPIFNNDGEVAYVRESFRDVTDINSLKKQFTGMRRLIGKVIESSSAAIVVGDIKGNIILMNKAAEDLFGFSFKECNQNYCVKDFYLPGVAKKIMRMLRSDQHGGKGKLVNTEIEILNAKGESIPGEIAASILYEDDKEIGSMGIYTDCSKRVEMEHRLKVIQNNLAQSEKLASIGRLAAGVAHEINNPLTGILFYASMALENDDLDEQEKKNFNYIVEDVNRCKKIVKDLLVYSRQTSPVKNVISLNELAEHSLYLIRDLNFLQDIQVVKTMSGEPMPVNVDKNQVTQVIINLVINAMDAMEGKGTLTLSSFYHPADQTVSLTISDTGSGIPKDHINKIFEPFFTTKPTGKGVGLGLSAAYGIIQENDGQISVKKTGPEGTTFLIQFPLHPSEKSEINDPEKGINQKGIDPKRDRPKKA